MIIGIAAVEATVKAHGGDADLQRYRQLAAIATLRTALNYSLARDIAEGSKPAQQAAEQKTLNLTAGAA